MIPVTLQIDPETFAKFQAAQEELADWLGFEPPEEWLMAFALEVTNPAFIVETARCMSRDYLRNRVMLR